MINIDIDDLIGNNTSPRMRSYELNEIQKVFNHYLKTLFDKLYSNYQKNLYELSMNGQVIYLEHLLNDAFDITLRRIYISDSAVFYRYIFNQNEGETPSYVYNTSETNNDQIYLYNEEEASTTFIIYVPVGLVTNWDLFNTLVKKYKLSSKHYKIEEI